MSLSRSARDSLYHFNSMPQAVEALLAEYKGVLLVVSHDRAFLEATADRLFVLRGDGLVRLFDGPYSEVPLL